MPSQALQPTTSLRTVGDVRKQPVLNLWCLASCPGRATPTSLISATVEVTPDHPQLVLLGRSRHLLDQLSGVSSTPYIAKQQFETMWMTRRLILRVHTHALRDCHHSGAPPLYDLAIAVSRGIDVPSECPFCSVTRASPKPEPHPRASKSPQAFLASLFVASVVS